MRYEDLILKKPVESRTYREDSAFVIRQMKSILDAQMRSGTIK